MNYIILQNWEDFLSHLQKDASSTFYNCYNHFQNHKVSCLKFTHKFFYKIFNI